MTPNEHDEPETSEELPTTELYPYARVTLGGPDDTMPDLPVMERLPDSQSLPDPGYPEMPAIAREHADGVAPNPPSSAPSGPLAPPEPLGPRESPAPPEPLVSEEPPGSQRPPAPPEPLPPLERPLPQEQPWSQEPPPPQVPPWQALGPADGPSARSWPRPPGPPPRPSFQPAKPAQPPPEPEEPEYVWPADPYAAPRAPAAAPPLRGHSVPWSEVRAAADYEAAGEQLAAPPSLPPHAEAGTRPPLPQAQAWRPAATPPAASAQAPEPAHRPAAETLTSDLLLPGRRAAPDGGWRETVYRVTGGLVRVGESPASLRRRDLVNRIRTPVDAGHHRVAVLSLKGGVGKTTATVGLGATLASLRGDRVIAVDGNPDRGTLSDKVHLETAATIRDLLNRRAMVGRYADVREFTSQAPSRLEILASDRDPGVSVAFSADDYRAVARVLEHYYSICITDCGTGLLHSAMAGILELADQIVLISSPSVDGARSASATLDWLAAHGHGALVRDAVVVLSPVRRKSKSKVDLDRLEQHFAARCRAVVRVPYDSHLEEGAEVELEYLDSETADAYLTLAALVADGFADRS
jgi:MinD-like ATPase involved in chromosome partitioning or flagellar assembly